MRRFSWGRFFGVAVAGLLMVQTTSVAIFTSSVHAQGSDSFSGAGATGSASTDYTLDQIGTWFNKDYTTNHQEGTDISGGDISLSIKEEANKPPTVSVPGAALSSVGGNPPGNLTFKLATYYQLGSFGNADNKEWLVFQGYYGTSLVNNLYLMFSDHNDANFYYAATLDMAATGPQGATTLTRVQHPNSLTEPIFAYIENLPLGNDGTFSRSVASCTSPPGIKITGPASATPIPDIQHTTDAPYNVSGGEAELLNSDCGNTKSNGWLTFWGVAVGQASNSVGGNCGLNTIFNGDLGKIFDQFIDCMFTKVVQPIISWAAQLITNAAGVSYIQPTNRIAFGGNECEHLLL